MGVWRLQKKKNQKLKIFFKYIKLISTISFYTKQGRYIYFYDFISTITFTILQSLTFDKWAFPRSARTQFINFPLTFDLRMYHSNKEKINYLLVQNFVLILFISCFLYFWIFFNVKMGQPYFENVHGNCQQTLKKINCYPFMPIYIENRMCASDCATKRVLCFQVVVCAAALFAVVAPPVVRTVPVSHVSHVSYTSPLLAAVPVYKPAVLASPLVALH